jgi:hypothetical protein
MPTKIKWPRKDPIIQCDEIPTPVIWFASILAVLMFGAWCYFHYLHSEVIQVFVEVQDPQSITIDAESRAHYGEEPTHTLAVETADGPSIIEHMGNSDSCTLVWDVKDFGRRKIRAVVEDHQPPTEEDIGALLVAPAVAGGPHCEEADCYKPSDCAELESHPGQPVQWAEPHGQCSEWVYSEFEDCCKYRQLWDFCMREWVGEIEWRCCRHQVKR